MERSSPQAHSSEISNGLIGLASSVGHCKVQLPPPLSIDIFLKLLYLIHLFSQSSIHSFIHSGAWPYFDDVEKGIAFEPTTAHRSSSQNLLAIGDKAGAVKIYNYPCLTKQVRG